MDGSVSRVEREDVERIATEFLNNLDCHDGPDKEFFQNLLPQPMQFGPKSILIEEFATGGAEATVREAIGIIFEKLKAKGAVCMSEPDSQVSPHQSVEEFKVSRTPIILKFDLLDRQLRVRCWFSKC